MSGLKRILLAEDDPRDAELTLSALQANKLTHEVIVVRDGAETLDYLRREGAFTQRLYGNPAVLLLDLKMPKIDGLQVLKTMRSDERFKTIPVVVLTSSREHPDLEMAYRLGANAYVVKPVKFEDFVDSVKRLGVFWGTVNEPPPEIATSVL